MLFDGPLGLVGAGEVRAKRLLRSKGISPAPGGHDCFRAQCRTEPIPRVCHFLRCTAQYQSK